ncbi:MAG TPA: hypothetical protein VK912_19455, partial [Longimicrobiales bacterium]|nr:hypothetical protein [Longimicrobiales bacterium]
AGRALSGALLLTALVGLLFIAGLAAALASAARRHLFIPAIGVPETWAWVLVLPWVLVVLTSVVAVLAVRSRAAGHALGIAGGSAAIGSGLLLATWLINLYA